MQNQHDAMAAARNSQKHRRLASKRRGAVAQRVSSLFGFWALLAQIAPISALAQSQSFNSVQDEGNNAASLTQLAEWIGQAASLSSTAQTPIPTALSSGLVGTGSSGFISASEPSLDGIAPMGSENGTETWYGSGANASGDYSIAFGEGSNSVGTASRH